MNGSEIDGASPARLRDGVGLVTMEPAEFFMKLPSSEALDPFVTAADDHYVLAHHGIARCSAEAWRLTIVEVDGKSHSISLEEIRAMPSREVATLMECAGNPMDPDKPLRIVSNAVWRGVPLGDLISKMNRQDASYIWMRGADWGNFAGVENDGYLKDIPISKAMDEDVIIAYEMNGAPLTAEHGFPLRAIVPGFYGTNSVKWLSGIFISTERPTGFYTTTLYNPDVDGVSTPVWAVHVNSRLLAPSEGAHIASGTAIEILGRAWSHEPVVAVEISVDGGVNWMPAQVEPRHSGYVWQTFKATWEPPITGKFEIASRATDATGAIQPGSLHINQIQRIHVLVK